MRHYHHGSRHRDNGNQLTVSSRSIRMLPASDVGGSWWCGIYICNVAGVGFDAQVEVGRLAGVQMKANINPAPPRL